MNKDYLKNESHEDGKNVLLFTIDGNQYKWNQEYITGAEIKHLAKIPTDVEIHLAVKKPWEDELISNDSKVNLARPEIEHFYCKKKLELTIDEKKFNWYSQYITGVEIKHLAGISSETELFLAITRPWEDELIKEDTIVDLARPGIEHFFSKKCNEEQFVIIYVKDIERKITRGKHTVAEIKKVGQVPIEYDLEEVIDGKLTPLDDNGTVLIKGREQFFCHPKDGSSS